METSAPSTVWIALAAIASLVALFQTARIVWERLSRTWAIRARARRAVEGEQHAEPMLRAAGYEVIERQARVVWTVYADGEPLEIPLRADLLVTREGRRYVAEVKTGKLAPRLDHAPTRRQLLEYRVAFGVDGILLVDADAGRVTVVELGIETARRDEGPAQRFALWAVVAGAVGAAAGWLLHP